MHINRLRGEGGDRYVCMCARKHTSAAITFILAFGLLMRGTAVVMEVVVALSLVRL